MHKAGPAVGYSLQRLLWTCLLYLQNCSVLYSLADLKNCIYTVDNEHYEHVINLTVVDGPAAESG